MDTTQNLTIFIDFGATRSAAKCVGDNGHEVLIDKFPTILDFNPDSKNAAERLTFVAPGEPIEGKEVRFFKVGLAQKSRFKGEDSVRSWVIQSMRSAGVMQSEKTLAAIFIAGLWQYAYDEAGTSVSKEKVLTVFTQPGFYSTKEMQTFADVVESARSELKFKTVSFQTEQQAAVSYIEKHPTSAGIKPITSEVLVIDCGGISIDAAYALTPPGEKREVDCAIGGGVYLDWLFETEVEKKVASAATRANAPANVAGRLKLKIMTHWQDHIRDQYDGQPGFGFESEYTSGDLTVELEDANIRPAFQTVGDIILKLIRKIDEHETNQNASRRVVLTGGLSESPYIRKYLKQELRGLEVDAHSGGAEAVIRGVDRQA